MTADRSRQRSTLALTVLALLAEEPMHAYRMHELIRQRGKDTVVNVAQRNSVYQTIARLLRIGWIRVQATQQDPGRPERVVYEITPEGRATATQWLKDMLGKPAREFPEFPAALAYLPLLTPAEARRQLAARAEHLRAVLAQSQAATRGALAQGLPRLFLVEDEYRQAMMKAEIAWVAGLVRALQDGELTWSAQWLRRIAAQFGAT
ncbi:MAG: PadR family transcriptional regulator [Pseudomonadota bacterium]